MNTPTCPKCNGVMERGNFSGNEVDWQEGTDQPYLREKGKVIISFSCKECGYIESYVKKN